MSLAETFHAAHKERQRRIAEAAAQPKIKTRPPSYEIPNTPLGVPKIAPFVSPDDAWIERQKQIPLPTKPKEPWFEIVEGPQEPPEIVPEPLRACVNINLIQREVARQFGLKRHDMLSDRRTADLAFPRHVVFYLCRRLTRRSLPEIGRKCGGRDHTTILHGVRKITALIETDAGLRATVEKLVERLGGDPE